MKVLLPLSKLRKHGACDLRMRIADFTAHHGHPPNDHSTFREWMEVTPNVNDVIWAIQCTQRLWKEIGTPFVDYLVLHRKPSACWMKDPILLFCYYTRDPLDRAEILRLLDKAEGVNHA